MGPGSGQPAGLELRQIVALLAKWRWLIVVVTGVCLATSAGLRTGCTPGMLRPQ